MVRVMTQPSPSTVKIAPTETGYLVRVGGRGTARESSVVHERAVSLLEDDGCRLVFDLSACVYLDSTFLGCIAHLGQRFGGTASGRFVVVGPFDHCKSLFGSTRIETLITIVDEAPEVTGDYAPIPLEEMKTPAFERHVMDCHARLAEIEGPERAVFAEIAESIARELDE